MKFPQGYFLIDEFSSPYRLDRYSKGGGIMLCVREEIPANFLALGIEILDEELNLQNIKMLMNCSYITLIKLK